MMGVTLFASWFGRQLRALGRNPLIRASDRFEALVILAVFATTIFAIPAAAHAGTLTHDAGVRTASEQSHSRHSVEAVAVAGSTTMATEVDSSAYVRAQWRDGTQLRTEGVIAPASVRAGEPLTIWLDDAGKVVAAPLTPADAELSAAVATGSVWVSIVACSALVAFVVSVGLGRSRDRAWERELNLLAHNDDGWANRQL